MKRITIFTLLAIVIYLLFEREREKQEGAFWRKRAEAYEALERERAEQEKRDKEDAKLFLQFLDEVYPSDPLTEEDRKALTAKMIDSEISWQETNAAFQEWKEKNA